jgi:ornithine lipid ester-linked acyl 2-hydroxylase
MDKQKKAFIRNEKRHLKWPWPKPDSNKTITLKDVTGSLKLLGGIMLLGVCFLILRRLPYGMIPFAILALISFYFIATWYLLHGYNLLLSLFTNTPPVFTELQKKEYFPQHELLESAENWDKIRKELDEILISTKNIPFLHKVAPVTRYITQESNEKDGGWRIFALKFGHRYIAANCEKAPFLYTLLQQIPNVRACFFSILDGRKHIPLHTGYFKGLIRYHLAMIVPEPKKTYIMIHEKKYHWYEGKGFLFDDMFPHEVYNRSEQRRIVIYMDIDRKLPQPLQLINRMLINIGMRSRLIASAQKKLEQAQLLK